MILTELEKERFWSHVSMGRLTDCWNWTAKTSLEGYGVMTLPSQKTDKRAHRISWTITNGQIPDGKNVLHKCDNRLCVNPYHLFVGTHQDNVADKVAKGRCPHGEKHCCAKLKERDVIGILILLRTGMFQREIASLFEVVTSTVNAIGRGTKWKHLACQRQSATV